MYLLYKSYDLFTIFPSLSHPRTLNFHLLHPHTQLSMQTIQPDSRIPHSIGEADLWLAPHKGSEATGVVYLTPPTKQKVCHKPVILGRK